MKTLIIIPARYQSSRYPGKPLAIVSGKSMIERMCLIAGKVKSVSGVYVATDDKRIFDHVEKCGHKALMTAESCRNGTERVFDAVSKLKDKPDVVINLQGDSVLTPPWILDALVSTMISQHDVQLATPAVQLTWEQYDELVGAKGKSATSGTTVTFDKNYNALYFSKSIIPAIRHRTAAPPYVFKHIGIYAYRLRALEKYLSYEPTPFERSEELEQLRALENGMPIKIALVDYRGRTHWSIDTPEDRKFVESIIAREGELA